MQPLQPIAGEPGKVGDQLTAAAVKKMLDGYVLKEKVDHLYNVYRIFWAINKHLVWWRTDETWKMEATNGRFW